MDINEKNQASFLRQDACVLAEAWMALWKAEELGCLDTSELDIRVQDCILFLKGKVADHRQCNLAEHLVKAITGVKKVYNGLVHRE